MKPDAVHPSLVFLLAALVLAPSTLHAWGPSVTFIPSTASTYRFEGDVPVSFRKGTGSYLGLTHRYYRPPGELSLRWEWEQREATFSIRLQGDFPAHRTRSHTTGTGIPRLLCVSEALFSGWIYNEQPRPGLLSFAFLDEDTIHHEVLVSLDFSGWRQVRITYPYPLPDTVQTLRITAPPQLRTGTLYFDNLVTWVERLHWQEAPDRTTLWPTPGAPDLPARLSSAPDDTDPPELRR